MLHCFSVKGNETHRLVVLGVQRLDEATSFCCVIIPTSIAKLFTTNVTFPTLFAIVVHIPNNSTFDASFRFFTKLVVQMLSVTNIVDKNFVAFAALLAVTRKSLAWTMAHVRTHVAASFTAHCM